MTILACHNLLLCLNYFYIVTFLCTMSFRWPPPCWMHRCTQNKKLHISENVHSEMLMISSCIACLSTFKFTGHLLYILLFKYPHRKKSGAVRSSERGAITHHWMRKDLLQKQMAKYSHANHYCVGHSSILLKPQVMVWWKLCG